MVVDFHTHVFPDKIASKTISALANGSGNLPFSDGTVDGLLNSMENANVDICVTLPVLTKPTQFESVSNFVFELNKKYSDGKRKIISFGGIHPECDNIFNKLNYLKVNGVKGVKIHPDYQRTFIDDPRYIEILTYAKELDLIVITHSGVDDGYKGEPVRCTPERVIEVVEKTNIKKLVLAHYGAHKQWQKVLDLLCYLDVYFDTAFTLHEIKEETFKEILTKHGEDKILFATDSPWRCVKEDIQTLKSYNLGKETENKILYKNALKLLGI